MHKIFFYNKFIIRLYMFRALCAHHQEVKVILYSIWYHHNCRWPSRAQIERILFSQPMHRSVISPTIIIPNVSIIRECLPSNTKHKYFLLFLRFPVMTRSSTVSSASLALPCFLHASRKDRDIVLLVLLP